LLAKVVVIASKVAQTRAAQDVIRPSMS